MSASSQTTITINQQAFHFQQEKLEPNDFRAAIQAPGDFEVWLVVRAPDPEGQLPKDDVQVTGPIAIANGQRYRVVPPGTFGLSPALPQCLLPEVAALTERLSGIEVVEASGLACVVIPTYPVAGPFNAPTTTLLLKVPPSYPHGKLDMFWTDKSLLLANGNVPRGAEHIEEVLDQQWRRFSWHPQSWSPSSSLSTYLAFVDVRLSRAE